MVDDKKRREGSEHEDDASAFDDIFEGHELDLNTSDDLEAVEDVTFSEQAEEALTPEEHPVLDDEAEQAMSDIFEDFTTSLGGDAPTPETMKAETFDDEDTFTDVFADTAESMDSPHVEDENFLDSDALGYNEENTATEIVEQAHAGEAEDVFAETPMVEDEDIFESDAFEDVNADFPEAGSEASLGDKELFDYDPNATDESMLSEEEIFSDTQADATDVSMAQAESFSGKPSGLSALIQSVAAMPQALISKIQAARGGSGGGGDEPPTGDDTAAMADPAYRKRKIIRMVALVILAFAFYTLLRGCSADDGQAPEIQATAYEPDVVATIDETTAIDVVETEVTPEPETAPTQAPRVSAPRAVEQAVRESVEQAVPDLGEFDVLEQDITLDDMQAKMPQGMPSITADSEIVLPVQDAMRIELPRSPEALAAAGEVTGKLSDLEASIMALDDRLGQINAGMRDDRITRLENALVDRGTPASQAILAEALEKIEDIDEKLSRLSDLQRQMKTLNAQVKSLQSDVLQQATIVGQQQREVNQSRQIAEMKQGEPAGISVQAVIPGRAWLRSETGVLMTVIVGDEVPGYGRVVSIDASSGTVVTSSKAVFREM